VVTAEGMAFGPEVAEAAVSGATATIAALAH
jgi:FMN-dependent NADH-azoreductase